MPQQGGSRDSGMEEYEPLVDGGEVRVGKSCSTVRCLLLFAFVFLLLCGVTIVIVLVYFQDNGEGASVTGYYNTAAVASDSGPCSTVGRTILEERNGSAVDAAIATLLCGGLHNPQSNGIGGGFFMVIYAVPRNGSVKELVTLDAREVAPLAATYDMYYNGTSSTIGGAAVAVPGEVKGYYAAWERFGRLPWRDLFQPAIDMNRPGVPVSKELAIKINSNWDEIRRFKEISAAFLTPGGLPLEEGELVHRPKLTATLEALAEGGSDVLYNGSLAQDVVDDLAECGGSIITLEDLYKYRALWKDPIETRIGERRLVSLPPPSSGAVLHFILNVMDGYEYSAVPAPTEEKVLMYHRFIETLKFGFAERTRLGDEDFVNTTEVVRNLTSRAYADAIRHMVTDAHTHAPAWYNPAYAVTPEAGTSHINVYAADGSAVAATSTINFEFASMCLGSRSGILFNNEMDDFAVNAAEESEPALPPTAANRIEAGKRPLSSMVPSLLLDPAGAVTSVLGGSGGPHILPATAFVAFLEHWLGMNLQAAIDTPRLHHQLEPNRVYYEQAVDKAILDGLASKGHELESRPINAVIQGIHILCPPNPAPQNKCIEAVSDRRKFGAPDGY